MGHGFLTGRYRSRQDLAENDFRRSQPRFAEENLTHNLQLVDSIEAFASEKGLTPAQFALAWVLHQGPDIVPIVGTKRVKYLEEDLVSAEVHLSPADLARVNEAVPEPAGERYDPGGMRSVGV